jgi:YteA family regulatory protein
MDRRQLAHFREELEDSKERFLQVISRLEETGLGDTMADSLGELSVYDNHPGDLGDALFERGKDIALRDNAHVMLEEVEAALSKMDAGTYGICEKCGRTIDEERLEALPWATHCFDCQRLDEVGDPTPRPLEEEILEPPFHRTFLDTASFEFTGFDGEDALQAVLKYGSSDTPQDIPGSYDFKALWPNSNERQGIVDRADAIPSDRASTRSRENEAASRAAEEGER